MATTTASPPPVVLFGYDSSPFTQKVRLALRLKQVPYTFVTVPSMMPRPILKDNFSVTYRRIPIIAIGKDIYLDTAIILEAIEHHFPEASGYGTLYPPNPSSNQPLRPLIRGFTYYWTDKPIYRVSTGLIPSSVWRTSFGTDRAGLIGHKLDPDKLERKVPQNLSSLDLHLSLLEPLLQTSSSWIFPTATPSAADIALYYQLHWGQEISFGRGIANLTGGGTSDGSGEGNAAVFNPQRYPALHAWFIRFQDHISALPLTESRLDHFAGRDEAALTDLLAQLKAYHLAGPEESPLLLLPTAAPPHTDLDSRNGLVPGTQVSIAPDDTGRNNPQLGTLVAIGPEEIVIQPLEQPALGNVRLHFPRVAFVVKPVDTAKL